MSKSLKTFSQTGRSAELDRGHDPVSEEAAEQGSQRWQGEQSVDAELAACAPLNLTSLLEPVSGQSLPLVQPDAQGT